MRNKKAVGWPYVVGLIIGLGVLVALLIILFKGKTTMISWIQNIKDTILG